MNRSTTIPFKKVLASSAIISAVLLLSLFAFSAPQAAEASRANELSDRIKALEAQSAQYQEEAERLRSESVSLQNSISAINIEKSAIQGQIDISQTKYDYLLVQIEETQRKIDQQKEVLGTTLANLYVDSDVTPIELIAGSKSLGDFMDKQGARSAIRDQLNRTIKKVRELKQELDTQRVETEQVLANLDAQRSALVEKEAELARLLEQTKGEEARFQQLNAEAKAQREAAFRELQSISTSNVPVSPIGYITKGSVIGYVGNTGFSFGPHLHLEVREGGAVTDPESYLQRNGWLRPTNGFITQHFGELSGNYVSGSHPGTDYGDAAGTPIRAASDGMLRRAHSGAFFNGNGAYGCMALIDHGGGVQTLYGHMTNSSCQ